MSALDNGIQRENKQLIPVTSLDVPLTKDLFLRSLIRELSGVLESVIGVDDASGFISIVGQNMGNAMDLEYKQALAVSALSRPQVAEVLVDLKARINGDFYIIEQTEERLVFGNKHCPFGDSVIGRESMCMMTSNVFGVIASQNLGYAKVTLTETIAKGDPGCRVVVHLRADAESVAAPGQQFYRVDL